MENPGKETYVEQMERVNQTNPFMLHNRIRAVALSEDRAEVRAEITEDSLNAMQTVHGGLMFVMAEVADLELALKNTTEEVQNVIYKNLSKRLAAMIKEDMDFMGPVRMKDVEEAQQKIVAVIRKLEDAGEIVISRGGGDDIVV